MSKIINKIGIMQGRVLPDSTEKLQVFPKKWKEEILSIKNLGFNYIELLDDKKNYLRNILGSKKDNIIDEIYSKKLKCKSVCMDSLCDYSLLKNGNLFSKKIDELINNFKRINNFTFIIPFFDENKLNNQKELHLVLKKLSGYDKFLIRNNLRFSLEIDLLAEIIKEEFKKFDFKNIGICYDLGNSINHNLNLSNEIILLKNYINHIHIKDKKNNKNIRIRKNLKQFNQAFRAIKKISFASPLILETCISPDPLKEAERNLITVKEYIKKNC